MEPAHLNNMQLYAFLFILSLLAYLVFFRSYWSANGCCKTPNQFPPGPIALPLLGHLHLLRPLLHRSLHALANRYGPILLLRLGTFGDTVVVSSPALAREFLKSHDLAFASRPSLVALQYIGGHDSLSFTFLPYGPRWKFFKKILVTHLLSPSSLEKMAIIRQEEIKLFLQSLLEKSRDGESVDLEEMLPVLTNNIICRMMLGMKSFGGKQNKEAEEYRKLVQEQIELSSKHFVVHLLLGSITKFDMFGYEKRLKTVNEKFMEIVDKIIEEHERKKKKQSKQEHETKQLIEEDGDEEDEEEDFLDILLKISEDEEAECKLTRQNIRAFLLVGFFNSYSLFSLINPLTLKLATNIG